jgi:HD-GYP domain-containing protein (c-di-GMP phosphodiesterase class II)
LFRAALIHDSWQILRRVRAFDQIAEWASLHHESITGNGYPFRRHGGEIPVQARIVAVADVFQAIAQDRPYRPTAGPDGVRAVLAQWLLRDRRPRGGELRSLLGSRHWQEGYADYLS